MAIFLDLEVLFLAGIAQDFIFDFAQPNARRFKTLIVDHTAHHERLSVRSGGDFVIVIELFGRFL